jgi:hypothetical protein
MAARIFVTAVLATFSIDSTLSIRTASNTGLPVVDLGYEVHQAISYDDTFDYYSFTNIPFAQPPLGDLRFAPPQPPKHREDYNHKSPNNGSGLRICPQASTGLGAAAYYFYLNYTTAQFAEQAGVINATQLNALVDTIPLYNNGQIPPFPGYKPKSGESEDCLYLDVLVPKSIFEGRGKPSAPVIGEWARLVFCISKANVTFKSRFMAEHILVAINSALVWPMAVALLAVSSVVVTIVSSMLRLIIGWALLAGLLGRNFMPRAELRMLACLIRELLSSGSRSTFICLAVIAATLRSLANLLEVGALSIRLW